MIDLTYSYITLKRKREGTYKRRLSFAKKKAKRAEWWCNGSAIYSH